LDQNAVKDVSVISSHRKAPRIKSPFPDEIKSPIKSKPVDILDEMLSK
jgi:hypothetical protein